MFISVSCCLGCEGGAGAAKGESSGGQAIGLSTCVSACLGLWGKGGPLTCRVLCVLCVLCSGWWQCDGLRPSSAASARQRGTGRGGQGGRSREGGTRQRTTTHRQRAGTTATGQRQAHEQSGLQGHAGAGQEVRRRANKTRGGRGQGRGHSRIETSNRRSICDLYRWYQEGCFLVVCVDI